MHDFSLNFTKIIQPKAGTLFALCMFLMLKWLIFNNIAYKIHIESRLNKLLSSLIRNHQ